MAVLLTGVAFFYLQSVEVNSGCLLSSFRAALVILPVSLLSNMVGFLNFLVPDVEAAISLMNPGYLYLETVFSKHNLGPWVLIASYWISALVKVSPAG